MTGDLFGTAPADEPLADGAMILRGFAAGDAPAIFREIQRLEAAAPFRHMTTPGGFRMSVAMLNCGAVGWVTDRKGYRYEPTDPVTGAPWPAMPPIFVKLAEAAAGQAGFAGFEPNGCLVNRYEPGAKMSLHQDRNEGNYAAPIVSVSIGLPARFMFGGLQRTDPVRRTKLESGDVVVWGGPARLAFHGIATLAGGAHPLTGGYRFNLTFRQVDVSQAEKPKKRARGAAE